ncbi:MAG: hypothetical protein IPK99_12135 [Flavobacteriales bacterium]|nr:hypothetical protein [Flavobacteriales bacterium]
MAPAIDLELKQYVLLGYLQRVREKFCEHKLYPYLHELRDHLDELAELRRRKRALEAGTARELLGIDPQERVLQFAPQLTPEGPLAVIDEVIGFALPELHGQLAQGEALRKRLAERIHFAPVGLMPLDTRNGYLFLRQGPEMRVYVYGTTLYPDTMDERHYRRVRTGYVTTCTVGLLDPCERVKAEIVRYRPELPNPAVFCFESDMDLPRIETFMPLAKQLVYHYIQKEFHSGAAAASDGISA